MHILFSRTKRFPRWLRGSCIEAQPQTVPGKDEPVLFTFFSDIIQHSKVNEVGGLVRERIMIGINDIMTFINQWKKYRQLWRLQRV